LYGRQKAEIQDGYKRLGVILCGS